MNTCYQFAGSGFSDSAAGACAWDKSGCVCSSVPGHQCQVHGDSASVQWLHKPPGSCEMQGLHPQQQAQGERSHSGTRQGLDPSETIF